MKRISTHTTFYYKKGGPFIFFAAIAFFAAIVASEMAAGRSEPSVLPFLGLGLMALVVYVIARTTAFDLVDELFDDGDDLIVRRGAVTERIPLSNIAEVTESMFVRNPRRVTLRFVKPAKLGREITFAPPAEFRLNPLALSESRIATDLRQRAARARAQATSD